MITQDQVTIVIPHLGANDDQERALTECLGSLLETCECKIVIAVNGQDQPLKFQSFLEQEFIKEKKDRISWLYIEDQGQCKATNAAVATTNTPWILISNDDMVYAPGWFEKLTNNLPDSLVCISPRLVEPRQGAPTFITYFCGGAGGDFDKQKWLDFAKLHSVGHMDLNSGFNLPFLITKELWDLVGGYDVNYDPWGSNSDSDLEYKIKLAGVQPMQSQDCIVYHFSQTSGTFEPQNNEYYQRNFVYFKEKWGFDRTDIGIWEATFEIPADNKYLPWWKGLLEEDR